MMRELKGKASPDAVREALVKEVEKRKINNASEEKRKHRDEENILW